MAMQQPVRSAIFTVFLIPAIFIVVPSCATTKKASEDNEKASSGREIIFGQVVEYPHPLPNYRPIWLNQPLENGKSEQTLLYHTWDFDKNGSFDCVEKVDSNGEVVESFFDFNSDGQIDFREK